ncbi:hypothetical protein LX32DRAFT_380685 [Colletotrichum zoysiae]|uniref:Uncharacterized protein n=1 Tax=Colletotrichum zoysiae TaxID=1216348 RepID=A0AAD9M4R4_9PEZI|nr:hypothetical protein LX32DRAFT_380685 [Colletotrichum zoysiae]
MHCSTQRISISANPTTSASLYQYFLCFPPLSRTPFQLNGGANKRMDRTALARAGICESFTPTPYLGWFDARVSSTYETRRPLQARTSSKPARLVLVLSFGQYAPHILPVSKTKVTKQSNKDPLQVPFRELAGCIFSAAERASSSHLVRCI